MNTTGRSIHAKAEHAREDGYFLEALQLLDEATLLYSEEKDFLGMSEAQGSRFLTLRHLYEKTGDVSYLILARYAAESGVGIAQKAEIPEALAMPLFNLAKADETLGNFSEAFDTYEKAIEAFKSAPPKPHDREGVLLDMEVHAYTCAYWAEKKELLPKAIEALKKLEASDEPQYTHDVWTSGGYMRLAQVLKEENPTEAKNYLHKAKEIIDANPELTLRKTQWEKLATSFE